MKTKTLMFAGLFVSLFCTAQIIRAQAPEVPPDMPPREMEIQNPADTYGNEVAGRVDQMIQAKDYNGASALLSENFDRFTKLRAMLFGKMLNALLTQDNIKDARQLYLQYAKQDQGLARAGAEPIYSYYVRKGDGRAVAEWTGQLMALPLPDDLKPQVSGWHFNAVCAGGVTAEARVLVKDFIGKFNAETCRAIFSPVITALIESGKYDDASRLLDTIEKACPPARDACPSSARDSGRPGSSARDGKGSRDLQSMALAAKARIIILKKQWKEGEAFFMKKAADLSDEDLAGLISFMASNARQKKEFEAVDRMSMFVFKGQKENNKAKNEAAACSLNMLKMNNQTAEIPARFEQLMTGGMPPSDLYPLYRECFYFTIQQENMESLKQLLVFGNKLNDKLEQTDLKKQMTLHMIDGAFVMGDYERSLQILDANSAYWSTEMLESSKVKISAHLALRNKNYKEAVEGFRKYMDYIAKSNTGAYNEITGLLYNSNMLLGFNASRIGNILRDNLKDEDGARKAYDEAEEYFKKAAEKAQPNSKELKYIEEQMAQIDARKKK